MLKISLWLEECVTFLWFRERYIIACYVFHVLCNVGITWTSGSFSAITLIDTTLRKKGTIHLWRNNTDVSYKYH